MLGSKSGTWEPRRKPGLPTGRPSSCLSESSDMRCLGFQLHLLVNREERVFSPFLEGGPVDLISQWSQELGSGASSVEVQRPISSGGGSEEPQTRETAGSLC